jgi:citrate lyase subunit beta / citryl-CoA lyase
MYILRSLLILPVNVPRFVEKAYSRGADAIMLDMEDAVPPHEKEKARRLVKDAIGMAGRGGANVFVRVNNDESLLTEDVDASIWPGLHALFLPKTETAEQIEALEAQIAGLELDRRISSGPVRLSVHIESPLGIMNLQEICSASPRIESVSIGVDDYFLQLGIPAASDGQALLFPFSFMVIACKAAGVHPMGILGSVSDFKDLHGFRTAAERARALGSTGGYCIHPDQVKILNEVFSPSHEEVERAEKVVEVFEEACSKGRASTTLEGKMVDTPICKRARMILEVAQAISRMDRRKAEAINRIDKLTYSNS